MKWALVLSGGGGNGLSHIGVLKALDNLKYKPSMICGTSSGAVIGASYACGMSPFEIEDFVRNNFNIAKYLEGMTFQLPGIGVIKLLQAEEALHKLLLKSGIDGGSKMLALFKKLTFNKNFNETRIPFCCNAVDLLSGEEVLLSKGNVAEAVRASIAFPGVFTPVKYEDKLLSDGSTLNNIPVWIPRIMGIKRVIAVDVTPFGPEKETEYTNAFVVFLRAYSISCHARKPSPFNKADLTIHAFKSRSNFNFNEIDKLVKIGEEAVYDLKSEIKAIIKPLRYFMGF